MRRYLPAGLMALGVGGFILDLIMRRQSAVSLVLLHVCLALAVVGGALLLVRRRPRRAEWMWLGLIVLEGLALGLPYNRGAAAATYFPAPTLNAQRKELTAPGRILASSGIFLGDLNAPLHMQAVRRVSSPQSSRLGPWLDANAPDGLTDQPALHAAAMQLWNLRQRILAPGDPESGPPWKKVSETASVRIYENPTALPGAWVVQSVRAYDTPAQMREALAAGEVDFRTRALVDTEVGEDTKWQLERRGRAREWAGFAGGGQAGGSVAVNMPSSGEVSVRLSHTGTGWLVVSMLFDGGWTASTRVEGTPWPSFDTPIVPAYGMLCAVPVNGANVTEITFQYRPRGWRHGLLAGSAGVLGVLMIVAFWLSRADFGGRAITARAGAIDGGTC
jgi:hypothetical protein